MGNKKYIVIALLCLIVAAAAGWFVTKHFQSAARQFKQPLIELKGGEATVNSALPAVTSDDDTVAVKLFLPSDEGITIVERRIQNNPLPVKMAEELAAEYLKGLKEGLNDTKLIGVYRDKRSIIYIDVSDEFRKNFSGDIRQEFELLKSLYQTITVNIPDTEDVRLLVDGKEIESLGGHFNALYPLGDTFREDLQQPAAKSPQTS